MAVIFKEFKKGMATTLFLASIFNFENFFGLQILPWKNQVGWSDKKKNKDV